MTRAGRRRTRRARIPLAVLVAAIAIAGTWAARADGAPGPPWSPAKISGMGLGPISCPTVRLCVTVGPQGEEVTTNPTGGASAWKNTHAGSGGQDIVNALSCSTDRVCVIGNTNGYLIATKDPLSGVWTAPDHVDPGNPITQISCQPGLCVAVTEGGKVLTSTDPTARRNPWKVTRISDAYLGAVSCPSTKLCVAGGTSHSRGGVFTSTSPQGPANTWRFVPTRDGFTGNDLSCPTTKFCAWFSGSQVLTSSNPAGGRRGWKLVTIGPRLGGSPDVSCATPHLCIGVAGTGSVIASANPSGGTREWVSTQIYPYDSGDSLGSVSCPTSSLCVVAAYGGTVWTSTDPAAATRLAPRLSRASLSAGGRRTPGLRITVTAATHAAAIKELNILPPAVEINYLPPEGVGVGIHSRRSGIILRDAHGTRLNFRIGHGFGLPGGALVLDRATRRLSITIRKPAITLARALVRGLSKYRRTLLFQVATTDTQGTTITVGLNVKGS